MKIKRYNEMFVDVDGNVWDDKEMTKRSFEYEDEMVALIDEGDPDQGTSFEIKFFEPCGEGEIDVTYIKGSPYRLTGKDFNEFIDESYLLSLSSYDIHPEQLGILSVYGDFTYGQIQKMLKSFGIRVVTR
ncbi:hypothetical protein EBU94_03650 [bacterium]|nr:hypothetical protein [bacterium]